MKVGKLGEFFFPQGVYLYSGSARGLGGLSSRLQRHLLGSSKKHWHIDYLRHVAVPLGYVYQTLLSGEMVVIVCPHEHPYIAPIEVFLKPIGQLVGENCRAGDGGSSAMLTPVECRWAKFLATVSGICIPVPGFGASDCQSGCAAHLFKLPVID